MSDINGASTDIRSCCNVKKRTNKTKGQVPSTFINLSEDVVLYHTCTCTALSNVKNFYMIICHFKFQGGFVGHSTVLSFVHS